MVILSYHPFQNEDETDASKVPCFSRRQIATCLQPHPLRGGRTFQIPPRSDEHAHQAKREDAIMFQYGVGNSKDDQKR